MGRWHEGLMFGGINPTPGLASAANWFPRTEEVGPGELRITFMGTAPFIRPGQMNTSIFVELGTSRCACSARRGAVPSSARRTWWRA